MDLSQAIFTSIDAIRSADTGSGGLAETQGAAIVNRMVQRDDPNYDETRADYWPLVVVDVIEKNDTTWGLTGAPDQSGFIVRMTLTTLRDPGRTVQNAVSARLFAKYDGAVLAAQTGWVFGPLSLDRRYQLRARGNVYVMVLEFAGRAGDTAAALVGRQGSITFSGLGIGTTLFGQSIEEDVAVVMAKIDLFDDQAERLTRQDITGTVTASFTESSMTPIIPIGAQGVLVVFEDTSGTKKTTYTNAVVVRKRRVSSTNGDAAVVYLTFRVSAVVEGTLPLVAA